MKRNVSLDEISDGKLYTSNDLAKLECGGCKGCSACCRNMGTSIILDPMDVWQLCEHLGKTFEMLLGRELELNVVDGIILPNLKMDGNTNACAFLNEQGRCAIHPFRPGFCRMFPLGRYYDMDGFKYFLQIHECFRENRTKVKIKKWLDIPDLKTYEAYICAWHDYLMAAEEHIEKAGDELLMKKTDMAILELFYMTPYTRESGFYPQFYERLETAKNLFKKHPIP